MTQRYIPRRIRGSWCVLDTETRLAMTEYGAGSVAALRARAAADQLNDQLADVPAPAEPVGLRSPAGLRAWRRARKLSQSALADMLEVRVVTINRWEQGKVPIPRTVELALLYLEQSLPVVRPLELEAV